VLNNAIQNAFLKKVGVMKACYVENKADKYMKLTGITSEQLDALEQMPDVVIIASDEDDYGLFELEVSYRTTGGEIKLSHVPLHHFFIDDNATGVGEGEYRICGESCNTTVSEALSMGLEYDGDWKDFDSYDAENNDAAGESEARRGYSKDSNENMYTTDPSQHSFLLTEAYMKFDLDGTGIAQLYRFWTGGTSFEYIAHERVEENPYGIGQIDPQPDAWAGRSIFDLLRQDQNASTSLMRATFDNAHASNNTRLAYHETMVNSSDVNSKVLGHPIRVRQPGMLQEIGVSSMVGSMLPLLQYLDMDSQNKAGATNASMGLDPDAMQSTDKQAVQNTIEKGLSQLEFMVRNFAETGLKPVFDKMLRLSIRHNPQKQVVEINGDYIPVDQATFEPTMSMHTRVGLGMPDVQSQLAGLGQIAQKQEQLISQFGMTNPVAGIDKLFNTMADMAKLMGIPALGRYFSEVTPEMAQQLQDMQDQAAEAARQEKPSEAIIVAENIRAEARIQEQRLENQEAVEVNSQKARMDIIEMMMKDDFNRDKMAQDLQLETARIEGGHVDKMEIKAQQDKDRENGMQQFAYKQLQDREKFLQGLQQQAQQQIQQKQQPQQPQQPPRPQGGQG
jgi:hypothetical protein